MSVTGNTERVAQEIASQLENADLYPIQLKTRIPKNEFWRMLKIGFFMWLGRGIRYSIPDIDTNNYDQIIAGTPVWMGRAASPIVNVLKKLNVNKKVTGLFATYGVDQGNVFSDLILKSKLPPISNCISIATSNLSNQIDLQNEIGSFVNILNKNYYLASQYSIYEG